MRKLILTQSFVKDLHEIRDFLAPKSPQASLNVIRAILRAAHELAVYPWLGHRRSDVMDQNVRFIECKRYIIAYRSDEQTVAVLRVIHSSRDFSAIRLD